MKVEVGQWWRDGVGVFRIMAIAEGYAMCRRLGSIFARSCGDILHDCKRDREPNYSEKMAAGHRLEDSDFKTGCGWTGKAFGASYPDAICLEGWLWDADSGTADPEGRGWLYDRGGDIPCPGCNPKGTKPGVRMRRTGAAA